MIQKILVLAGFISWILLQASGAQSAICYVKASATGKNDGTSWADAYTDLQSALNTGVPSEDQIWVAAGTYKPTNDTDKTKSFVMGYLPIYGGFAGTNETTVSQRNWVAHPTILSGNLGAVRSDRIMWTNFLTGRLDGFTLTGGTCGLSSFSHHPTIANCTFSNNSGTGGCGITNYYGSMIITNCTFTGNTASDNGAAIYNEDASPTITNCIFTGNTANTSSSLGAGGGAIYLGGVGKPAITNCVFTGNTVNTTDALWWTKGGGAIFNSAKPILTNCVFAGNTATGPRAEGGAIYNYGTMTLTNCTFTGNTADYGGAYFDMKTSTLTNCLLWADSSAHVQEIDLKSVSPTCSHCDIQGSGGSSSWNSAFGTNGGGNIDSDPKFLTPSLRAGTGWFTTGAGLSLQSSSPCRHAGTATGAPLADILGTSWATGTPDIGAYQYYSVTRKNAVAGWERY